MNTTSSSSAHERNEHAAEFPIRLYTALRTVRLYPPTNPQVIQNTAAAYQAYKALLDSSPSNDVTIALSEQKIIVNGHHLSEKEQVRPQIVGLTTFLQQLKLHSLSFNKAFTQEDCSGFIGTLATLFGKKEIEESLSDLLQAANIDSVTTDSKRYVVVREGEQVVSQDQIGFGSGVGISDDEMASFILGQTGVSTAFAGSLPKELEPIISLFSEALQGHENPAQLTSAFFNALNDQPTDNIQHHDDIEASANTIANLAPENLSKLLTLLPQTESSNEVLNATINHLQPKQLNALVNSLVIDLAQQSPGSASGKEGTSTQHDIIKRLVQTNKGTEIKKSIALNVDARQLLDNPSTTIAELPPHLLNRLRQPDWSAPVLANAVQQAVDKQQGTDTPIDTTAVNRMLAHYEQLLDDTTQQQVATQAGAQLASMGGAELGNVLTQKFKGLFGDKLYHQVINQVSDDLLDETIEHLTPKQLNRMVAMLTSSIPLAIDNNGDPDLTAVDDDMLSKLVNTTRGTEIKKSIALNVDARQLLDNPSTTIAELPPHLLNRLRQPDWSAPVLANAVQQAVDKQQGTDTPIDTTAVNRMLAHYEQLLDDKTQQQVATQAGAQLASMGGAELGNVLTQKFKGLFGDKLYHQVINQVSDDLLDETIEHLTPKQLNRMVAMLTSSIPLAIDNNGDPDLTAVDDDMLSKLVNTTRGTEIKKSIALNVDARQLLDNPSTTIAELPPHLLNRLRQPDWSAPVLANAVQQAVDKQQGTDTPIDTTAVNRMLAHYEQLLDDKTQQQVATQAGAQLASMGGAELGNVLTQKFKGLFGDKLYHQVINQVSDDLLDETIEHLTPKQLNRMVAMLTSSIPLAIDNNGDPDLTAVDDDMLSKLVNTTRGTEIKKSIALNVDARQLLDNPSTTIAELPPHLLNRLRQPDWSAPVLANAVQQAVDKQQGTDTPIDTTAVNRMLAHYEQLLDDKTQQQVATQAGAQLASMGGAELGNVLTQKFKGLFGDKLYHQVINQVSDDLLDETIEHLTPKQLNRMVAMLTSSIPLAIDNNGDPDLTAVNDDMLNRLVQTTKGPIVKQLISHQIDAHTLQRSAASRLSPPANLQKRLQQPEWSSPLLVTAAQLAVDTSFTGNHQTNLEGFNQILSNYDTVLNQEQQVQVATQAGAQLADFEDNDLGKMLIQRFKGLFGDQLYTEVIKHLTDEKLATLTQQMYRFATGQELLPEGESNQDVAAAYKRLMQTVKNVKIRTVVEMHQERQQKEAENKAEKITKGIAAILANDTQQLADKSICQEIPNTIIQFIKDGKKSEADTLLMHTAIAIQSTSEQIRINGVETLALTAQKLAEHKQWDRLVKLLPALEQALQLVVTGETSIKLIITAISQLAHHFLEQNNYAKAFEIVHAINRITSSTGDIAVSKTIQEHGIAVLDQISSDSILERLLKAYLHDEEKREKAGNLLTDLGKRSARYQLQHLMNSESRFERKLLLYLIKQTGNAAKNILLEQLQQPSPWYVTRNIVRLLGEMGGASLIHAIQPFINHQDIRVQQEVLNTAIKLGGDEIPAFLQLALSSMDDTIKTKVVHHMGTLPDEEYVRPLTELLDQNKSMQGKNKNLFQLTICKTLGIIGSRRALQTLQSVAQSKSVLGIAGYADEVRNAAHQTARRIRARIDSEQSPQLPNSTTIHPPQNKQTKPDSQSSSMNNQEALIFQMVEQGKKEEAKEALFDLVTATARAGDFENAERLRERIYEIDPMALSEIIRSGEIIEQEKNGAINQDDLHTWAKLTDELTSAEFQTIYHELRERIFAPEESIVHQGDHNDELLLINQGSIKASHRMNDKEIFITSLGRGEIIGENFFTPSVWTINLTALTQARIYVLKQDQLAKWKEQFPGLEDKLKNFYSKNNKVPAILKKKGLERRRYERFNISRKIQVQPTDSKGNPIGRGFRADIIDVSKGGLAFLIRITKKENAKLLLGRSLQIVLPVGGKSNYLYLQGISIGIQPFNVFESDYAVHFKFHNQLDAGMMQQILG